MDWSFPPARLRGAAHVRGERMAVAIVTAAAAMIAIASPSTAATSAGPALLGPAAVSGSTGPTDSGSPAPSFPEGTVGLNASGFHWQLYSTYGSQSFCNSMGVYYTQNPPKGWAPVGGHQCDESIYGPAWFLYLWTQHT